MENYPFIFFDGICVLCNGTIDFVLRHDKNNKFRYVPIQSEAGKKATKKLKLPNYTDTVILYLENKVFTESDAVIEIVRLLPTPWKWLVVVKIIPKVIRDNIYRWIAKNRYRWFGEKESCRIPAHHEKQFFPEAKDLHI